MLYKRSWSPRFDSFTGIAETKVQLRHSSNTVVFLVFHYLQYDSECDYLQLCATYSCRQFDSLSRLRVGAGRHFDDICAAREF